MITAVALVAFTGSANAVVIYQEDFSGIAATELHGLAPDTVGTNLWSSEAGFLDAAGNVSAQGNSSALLAFTPTAGNIYTLSANMTVPTTSSQFVTLGFTEKQNVDFNFAANQLNGYGSMQYRGSTGGNKVQTFTGVKNTGVVTHNITNNVTRNFQIVLDATDATSTNWTFEFSLDGSVIDTAATVAGGDAGVIKYVGFTSGGSDATFDNFLLSGVAVPEPSSTALLGLGSIALILRRRK